MTSAHIQYEFCPHTIVLHDSHNLHITNYIVAGSLSSTDLCDYHSMQQQRTKSCTDIATAFKAVVSTQLEKSTNKTTAV